MIQMGTRSRWKSLRKKLGQSREFMVIVEKRRKYNPNEFTGCPIPSSATSLFVLGVKPCANERSESAFAPICRKHSMSGILFYFSTPTTEMCPNTLQSRNYLRRRKSDIGLGWNLQGTVNPILSAHPKHRGNHVHLRRSHI
jgi:hypothetical protein